MESTLSGQLPVAALHNIQIFCQCCVQCRPHSYSILHYLDKTEHLFFPLNLCVSQQRCTKGTVWFAALRVCFRIRAVLKMNLSVTKLWSAGASSGELNRKRLTFSQASTAIFPFHFSGKRGTRVITKDVLCGEFQRHIGRRQRKWKEVTRLHQRPYKLCQGGFKGPRIWKTWYTAHVRVWK